MVDNDPIYGEMLYYDRMIDKDKAEGSWCKDFWYLRAKTCDGCPDEDRTIRWYTYEKEVLPHRGIWAVVWKLL